MPTTRTTHRADEIEALLSPLEARPVKLSTPEIARRRSGLAFGQELSRLQGAQPSAVRARLAELVVLGKATQQEVLAVGAELARRGLLAGGLATRDH